MAIKAIIFDYGNVISSFDNLLFLEEISKYTGNTALELHNKIYVETDFMRQFETGLISTDEFFNSTVKLCSLEISKEQFVNAFTGIFKPIQKTHDIIRKLKPAYKLGLLSNTSEWDFEYEIKRNDIFNLFNTVSVSFQVRSMKPEKKIYLDALSKLKLRPDECVYIDDIREYVDAASTIGINSIHYTSHENMVESLRRSNVFFD